MAGVFVQFSTEKFVEQPKLHAQVYHVENLEDEKEKRKRVEAISGCRKNKADRGKTIRREGDVTDDSDTDGEGNRLI